MKKNQINFRIIIYIMDKSLEFRLTKDLLEKMYNKFFFFFL